MQPFLMVAPLLHQRATRKNKSVIKKGMKQERMCPLLYLARSTPNPVFPSLPATRRSPATPPRPGEATRPYYRPPPLGGLRGGEAQPFFLRKKPQRSLPHGGGYKESVIRVRSSPLLRWGLVGE